MRRLRSNPGSAKPFQAKSIINQDDTNNSQTTSKYFVSPYKNLVKEQKVVLNDSVSEAGDFKTPKVVRKVQKVNENKNDAKKKGKRVNKGKGKRGQVNTLVKMLEKQFSNTKCNPEHVQMAVALSKSEQKDDFEITSQEKVLNVRATLEQFGFKSNNKETGDVIVKDVKRAKNSKFRFITPTLFIKTQENREIDVAKKVSLILSENIAPNIDKKDEYYVSSDYLKSILSFTPTCFLKSQNNLEKNNFYVPILNLSQSTFKCGSLLKDWAKIPGRDKSPLKNNKKNDFDEIIDLTDEEKIDFSEEVKVKNEREMSPDLFDSSDDEINDKDLRLSFNKRINSSSNKIIEAQSVKSLIMSDSESDFETFKSTKGIDHFESFNVEGDEFAFSVSQKCNEELNDSRKSFELNEMNSHLNKDKSNEIGYVNNDGDEISDLVYLGIKNLDSDDKNESLNELNEPKIELNEDNNSKSGFEMIKSTKGIDHFESFNIDGDELAFRLSQKRNDKELNDSRKSFELNEMNSQLNKDKSNEIGYVNNDDDEISDLVYLGIKNLHSDDKNESLSQLNEPKNELIEDNNSKSGFEMFKSTKGIDRFESFNIDGDEFAFRLSQKRNDKELNDSRKSFELNEMNSQLNKDKSNEIGYINNDGDEISDLVYLGIKNLDSDDKNESLSQLNEPKNELIEDNNSKSGFEMFKSTKGINRFESFNIDGDELAFRLSQKRNDKELNDSRKSFELNEMNSQLNKDKSNEIGYVNNDGDEISDLVYLGIKNLDSDDKNESLSQLNEPKNELIEDNNSKSGFGMFKSMKGINRFESFNIDCDEFAFRLSEKRNDKELNDSRKSFELNEMNSQLNKDKSNEIGYVNNDDDEISDLVYLGIKNLDSDDKNESLSELNEPKNELNEDNNSKSDFEMFKSTKGIDRFESFKIDGDEFAFRLSQKCNDKELNDSRKSFELNEMNSQLNKDKSNEIGYVNNDGDEISDLVYLGIKDLDSDDDKSLSQSLNETKSELIDNNSDNKSQSDDVFDLTQELDEENKNDQFINKSKMFNEEDVILDLTQDSDEEDKFSDVSQEINSLISSFNDNVESDDESNRFEYELYFKINSNKEKFIKYVDKNNEFKSNDDFINDLISKPLKKSDVQNDDDKTNLFTPKKFKKSLSSEQIKSVKKPTPKKFKKSLTFSSPRETQKTLSFFFKNDDLKEISDSKNNPSDTINISDEEINYSSVYSTPKTNKSKKSPLNDLIQNQNTPKLIHKRITELTKTLPLKRTDENCSSTPDNVVIKTRNITPMPNYDGMNTPTIEGELEKVGVKNLKRRRGVQILKHIYYSTHPVLGNDLEQNDDSDDGDCKAKRRKSDCDLNDGEDLMVSSRSDLDGMKRNKDGIEIVGDIPESNDLIFERKPSKKISSCALPLHIAWFNFLTSNPEIKENLLLYVPLQLEVLYEMMKKEGLNYHIQDLLTFLDKKCITIRTNQQSGQKQHLRNNKD